MGKVVKSTIVIYDDFKNILIAERGKGKNTPKQWGLFGKELKGKETAERAIIKAVDKDIKCTIFDLENFKEYSANENGDETIQVYTGTVREYITTHKTINTVRWIGKKDIEQYNFSHEDLEIIKEYFSI
ncbi:hypothetical protein [Clostridium sp. 29_15]|uniref:hypothetical protein n=1 Tax=Clostridium sp. 29_15 TaxID=1896982 RepID=UPI00095F82EA|nr:hypothetical protein [Clostridium sp. 29_15]OKZ85435.1 MAG: hypothetical protein BHW04_09230 [Clostridium sp. 29_15]